MNLDKKTILRLTLTGIFIFGVSISVAYRLFHIQLTAEPELEERTERYTRLKDVPADRGNIYSDDGGLLATTLPVYDIRMDFKADGLTDKRFNENISELADRMAGSFGGTSYSWLNDFKKYRREGKRYQLLVRNVNYRELQKVKQFPLAKLSPYRGGVRFEKKVTRENPFGEKAKRTVGKYSFGKQKGIYGLELAYDSLLSGRNGTRLERKIASGDWMPMNDSDELIAIDGADIYTTIDVNVQDILQNALKKKMEEHNAEVGCAIFMEVETGFIKGIVNLDKCEDGQYREKLNHAIGTATEPGSTFKLPAILAAIESGKTTIDAIVDTKKGKHRFHNRIMKDSNDKGYGKISVQRAFELSSNVGISRIVNDAFKNDKNGFVDQLRRFGLDQRTGVSIPGEPNPYIKTPDDKNGYWSGVTLPWMSIGYELTLTPLQTLTFYNAIANDGVMVKPQLVKEIRRNGAVILEAEPIIINKDFLSESTLNDARTLLKGVVENGTGKNLRSPHFEISGKTGTAQVAVDGSYKNSNNRAKQYQASFVGYFPSDDPKYSCIVLVNDPTTGHYYGNRVAGPVFLEIAEKYYAKNFMIEFAQKEIVAKGPISVSGHAQDLNNVCQVLDISTSDIISENEWVSTKSTKEGIQITPLAKLDNKVPNVRGMAIMDAIPLLENMGLVVQYNGSGIVKKQSLKKGASFELNDQISLSLAQ